MSDDCFTGAYALRSITWYLHDLKKARELLAGALGFRERSWDEVRSQELDGSGEETVAFEAAACRVVCAVPGRTGTPAGRFLSQHPAGIGRITFSVDDLERARQQLGQRGATFISGDRPPHHASFELATPIDDLTFGFVQHPSGGSSESGRAGGLPGPSHFDHITLNTSTILPMQLWLAHMFGLRKHWETEFHTAGATAEACRSSGLKSVVMADARSKLKFALNEAKRPNFFASQIELFRKDHGGSGVQHVAIHVQDIVSVVRAMRDRGVRFACVPARYYDQLPSRLQQIGVGAVSEPVEHLRDLGILADGSGPGRYLLQIFVEDEASFQGGSSRSPFFFELIERKGCDEFGAGNFRALFDSIAAVQTTRAEAP